MSKINVRDELVNVTEKGTETITYMKAIHGKHLNYEDAILSLLELTAKQQEQISGLTAVCMGQLHHLNNLQRQINDLRNHKADAHG